MSQPQLEIEVFEDKWEAWGDPNVPENHQLMQFLREAGGISDTVPPGHYIFKAVVLDPTDIMLSLEPAEE